MYKAIQYSLIFVIMFIFIAVSMGQDAFDQTVAQIKSVEIELEQNQQRIKEKRQSGEEEITKFRKSHKLNAPKDMFESDDDYDKRKNQLDKLVAQRRTEIQERHLEGIQPHLKDMQIQITRLSSLYRKVFRANPFTATLGTYDANNEFFPISFETKIQRINTRLYLSKEHARNLYHNWDKVVKIGYLSIDPGYRRTLAMVKLMYTPIWPDGITWTIDEVCDLGDNNRAVDFSPNGHHIATGDATNIVLGEVSSGERVWRGQNSYLYNTGRYFLDFNRPGKKIYEKRTGYASFYEIAFSPDGQYLATVDDGRSLILWKATSGKQIHEIKYIGYVYNALCFSPGSQYLATGGSTEKVTIWETETGTEVRQLEHGSDINAVSFSPNGQYLAAGDDDGEVTIWKANDGTKVRQMEHSNSVESVSFSPDGQYITTGLGSKVTIWEVSGGTKVQEMEHQDSIYVAIFSPDGQYLAVGGDDKLITFYRIPTDITIQTKIIKEKVIRASSVVNDLAWSPYGNLISDGKKVYRTLLQPESDDIEKPDKHIVPTKRQRRLDGPLDQYIPIALRTNSDAVAVVIGIQDYLESTVPSVKYAKRDAQLVREYLTKTFGYDEYNILPRDPNQLMTVGNFKTLIRQQLQDYVKKNGTSDVFIYYAGHGAPSTETQEAFLAPYDFNPNVDVNTYNAYRLKDFYADLLKIECRSLTIVLDTCFSGMTGDGQVLIQNISPVILPKLEISKQVLLSHPKAIILTSTSSDRVSNWYPEKKHSLFTYFFLRGVQGAADKNFDSRITVGELETYLLDENNGVPYWARRLFSRSQVPQVHASDKNIVIVDVER